MNLDLLNTDEFNRAVADYFYLINRKYPEKSALKIVGDHYQLRSEFRTLLYRGICSVKQAQNRSQRLVQSLPDYLIVDGYNVLLTLLNYRLGRFVFISTDNLCRDAGSLFGKIKKESLLMDCAALLIDYLRAYRSISVIIYLDSPVSHSQDHAQLLNQLLLKNNINGKVELVHSADFSIKHHMDGTIATSDSALIDSCSNPIIDIPHQIIEQKYEAKLFDISSKLSEIGNHRVMI
jgi:hypothetical protein